VCRTDTRSYALNVTARWHIVIPSDSWQIRSLSDRVLQICSMSWASLGARPTRGRRGVLEFGVVAVVPPGRDA
jgi:hypothetical protein